MREIVLCGHHEPGGVLVQAVDYPGAEFATDTGKAVAVGKQGIDKRTAAQRSGRMNDESRSLVDHEHVIVLEDNVQIHLLRGEVDRNRIRNLKDDGLTGSDPEGRLRNLFTIYRDMSVMDQRADIGAALTDILLHHQEAVQTKSGLLRLDQEAVGFHLLR